MANEQANITGLLARLRSGDRSALDRLMPLVYDELRRLAGRFMQNEGEQTLQSTALVHEAYLRLAGTDSIDWRNRAHFFGVAATMIRNILVDRARARRSEKRGGGVCRLSLSEELAPASAREPDLVALDDALLSLSRMDEQSARIVELRYFAGLTIEETAEAMGLSESTIKRDWLTAKAFLYRELTQRGAFAQ